MIEASPLERYRLYADVRAALADTLDDLAAVVTRLRLEHLTKELTRLTEQVRSDRLRLLLIGDFKSGKSSMINAMFGEYLTPAVPHPSSPVILILRGSTEAGIVLRRSPAGSDGPGGNDLTVDHQELQRIMSSQTETTGKFTVAEVEADSKILHNGFEVIDTPGSHQDAESQRLIFEYLSTADAVIFVKSALYPFADNEDALLERTRQVMGKRLFIALNKMDGIPSEDRPRLERDTRRLLRQVIVDDRRLFFVSARLATLGRADDDLGALRDSGLPELEAELADYLATQVALPRLREFMTMARNHVRMIRNLLSEQAAAYRRSTSAVDDGHIIQMSEVLAVIKNERDRTVNALRTEIMLLSREVQDLGRKLYLNLAEKVPAWLAEFKPQTLFGLNPLRTQSQIQAAVREITEHLGRKLEAEYVAWTQDTLSPHLLGRLGDVQARFVRHLTAFGADGTWSLPDLPVKGLVVRSEFETGLMLKELTRRMTFLGLAAGVVSATPVGLTLTVLGSGVVSAFWTKRMSNQLRDRVAVEVQLTLRRDADRFGRELAAAMDTQLRAVEKSVDDHFAANEELLTTRLNVARTSTVQPSHDADSSVTGAFEDIADKITAVAARIDEDLGARR